jgi:benzodiazapine receptor
MTRSAVAFLVFVGTTLLTGFAGSMVTDDAVNTWYLEIHKPGWTPPDWVFPVVWTSLFLMMGLSVWRIWQQAGFVRARTALMLFAAQLVLNFTWSALFFGLRNPGAALIEIFVLIAAVAGTIAAFARHDSIAAWLLAPYLAWISFAAVLNGSIWWMN